MLGCIKVNHWYLYHNHLSVVITILRLVAVSNWQKLAAFSQMTTRAKHGLAARHLARR